MKYIRTKDKIEKVPNDYANKLVECPNLVIADNIEELCDEFVLTDNEGKHHYESVEKTIWLLGASLYITTVRGAIWTDKGLIYVAKMNEKGELELL